MGDLGGHEHLAKLRPKAQFYEEVRVWMAKFDAAERQARGEPLPDDIKRLLNQLVAESTASGEVLDIYDAAGMPRPTLTDLTPTFLARAQQASNPHLAIEALRAMLTEESTRPVEREPADAVPGDEVREHGIVDGESRSEFHALMMPYAAQNDGTRPTTSTRRMSEVAHFRSAAYRGAMDSICSITSLIAAGGLSGG
jgi:hypothetical protein